MFRFLLLGIFIPLTASLQETGELFFSIDMPLGNVAVSQNEEQQIQYFFTLHPEAKPEGAKVYEIRDNNACPFPDSAFQDKFTTTLGIFLDKQNRLWVLDHGKYGLKTPKLFAFNSLTGDLIVEYIFPREVVKKWVMLNDLTVTPDGKHVFISAPGMFKKRSSIIIYDVEENSSRRILTDHPTVMRNKMLIEVDGIKMRFLLGLVKVRPGVDGIDIDSQGKYLYYTPMADTAIYRLPVAACLDPLVTEENLETMIQWVGNRPVCDGIRIDKKDLIYVTDIENHRILAMDNYGDSKEILFNREIRWVDGLSVGADGFLYITDSALQYVIMKSKKKIARHKPFGLWRIRID